MKKVLATIAVLGLFAGLANAQQLSLQDGTRNLVLTNDTGEDIAGVRGLEIKSTSALLNNTGAGSFGFVLGASGNAVTLGALADVGFAPGAVLTTGTTYGGNAPDTTPAFSNDLSETVLGVGTSQVPVTFPAPVVPEPATGLMAAFGLLGLLGLRRRR